MSRTVHWTPARRLLTLLSWLVGFAGVLYFVIPWMAFRLRVARR
jgi:hypothetical protein